MKPLILAVAALSIGIGAAYAGDGGDLPMPGPASVSVAPATGNATHAKAAAPRFHAFVARHSTTTSLFPPTAAGGAAHD